MTSTTVVPPASTGAPSNTFLVSRSRVGAWAVSDPETVGVPGYGPGEDVDDDVRRGAGGQAQVDRPVGETAVVTALAVLWPVMKLTEEVVAFPAPGSVRVTSSHPAFTGVTTVTLRVTEPDDAGWDAYRGRSPAGGRDPPGGRAPVRPPRPVRVSIRRAGARVPVVPGSVGVPAVVQPATSASSCTVPVPYEAQA